LLLSQITSDNFLSNTFHAYKYYEFMTTIDWLILVIYFALILYFILRIRKARTVDDFAVGSRQIPKGIIFATISANFIGPGYSMGLVNKAANSGIIWFFIFAAFSLQTVLVGIFLAPKINKFSKAYTVGDVMGYRYGKLAKIFTGIMSFAYCAGVVGLIAKASGEIIHGLTGFPILYTIIFSTIFILFYSTFGGIKSDIIIDTIQFVILGIFFPVIIILMFNEVGVDNLISKIPPDLLDIKFTLGTFGIMLGFFLGESLVPPYFNRALAAKSDSAAKGGFIFSGVFSLAWFFVCVSLGLLAAGLFPSEGNIWMTNLKHFAPIGIFGLSIAAMISIILSSQDSFLNAASVSFNKDILSVFSNKKVVGEKLKSYRIVNLSVGLFAVVFAYKIPTIIDAIMFCYTLWAPTIVLPLVIGILKPNVKPLSGILAIVAGAVATGLWEWVFDSPMGLPSLLIGVVFNQIFFWSSEFLIKNRIESSLLKPFNQ